MDWSKYGRWRHEKEWWEIQFMKWMETKHPDKLKYNPKLINITDTEIVFGMSKHYGRLHVDKETILNDLKNERVDS